MIQKSSNVGAAKIALALPRETMWDLFRRVGFGAAPRARLSRRGGRHGCGRYKTWRPIEQATMPTATASRVSLVQLARAYTVFARDGELVPLTLVKTGARGERRAGPLGRDGARGARACSSWRCSPAAPAPRARIMGYRVAGKTGTAHKQENGGYAADKYLSSFVGLAPASRAAPRGRGDDRRALRRAALRRRRRRAGLRAGHAGRAAHARRAARRADEAARAAGRGRGERRRAPR